MEKVIVLGIGNRLMMDDGIGIYLVEEMMRDASAQNTQYIIGESDIDYCIQQIENATFVIIIDCTITGGQPGEITIHSLDHLVVSRSFDFSVHNLHLFQVLYQLRNQIKGYLIGIEPYKISFNFGLSKVIENKRNEIEKNVKEVIQQLINIA
ncbi:hydrogenase maturation protease [Lysinibacillus varians]|uniref:Hydrogenase maturation protease n=1 Tax=Lysinibacillus varians TaxID=1145276 RepID=A0ABY2TER0_9BACI|nr:hydrogenase maturation protease [Lysinibacillus varians]AHN21362.1 hydrogenase maturation protease [Lysinibacillus varians]TKI67136.1 hydrogenase maturation protease [Lysinibacillus varians]